MDVGIIIATDYVIIAYLMYTNNSSLKPFLMSNSSYDLLQKMKIKGLKLTNSSVRKVKSTIEYNFIQLDSLLIYHQEKVRNKLIDDRYFSPETIAVLEYKGQSYAVEKA